MNAEAAFNGGGAGLGWKIEKIGKCNWAIGAIGENWPITVSMTVFNVIEIGTKKLGNWPKIGEIGQ